MLINLVQVFRSRLRFRLQNTSRNDNLILSRMACLGNNSFMLTRYCSSFQILNLQKNRIEWDMLDARTPLKARSVARIFSRRDIVKIVSLQKFNIFDMKFAPKAIIIDTYSELTDQKFEIEGQSFFSSFSDINIRKSNMNSHGLLGVYDLEELYRTYFTKLRAVYGRDVPIVVILFPAKLDPRKQFKQRAEKIKNAIYAISNDPSLALKILDIADHDIEPHKNDEFYYHFSDKTYRKYALGLEKLLEDLKVCNE